MRERGLGHAPQSFLTRNAWKRLRGWIRFEESGVGVESVDWERRELKRARMTFKMGERVLIKACVARTKVK